MREVKAGWVEGAALAAHVEVGKHHLRVDEPADKGGGDTGPSPHEMLLSSLAACTSVTLRMYARRKAWPLTDVRVHMSGKREGGRFVINRRIQLEGALDLDQRTRLLEIADRCPVHRTLTGEVVVIDTNEAPPGSDDSSESMEEREP